ncbi:MAG: pyridoxine 5'-phosphate oxidase C-terminal domain-containing protein [Planctomycetota bacterium]
MGVIAGEEPADDIAVPRPPHWGGFRLWARRVELWIGGKGRFHDRAEWIRELSPAGDGFMGGSWSRTRLQP